jgi:hypothetical protein
MPRIFTKPSALGLILAVTLLPSVSAQAETHLARETDHYIKSFQHRPVIGLGKLIATLLPPHGFKDLTWGYLADSPIIAWQTSGVHYGSSEDWRIGFVRVEINGREPQILLRTWQTLPWSVTLSGGTSDNATPDSIEISPGVNDGKYNCFGAGTRNCTFSVKDLFRSPYLKSGFLCQPYSFGDSFGGQKVVFVVSASGKAKALLVYQLSEGSGGASTSLHIYPLSHASKLCTPTSMPFLSHGPVTLLNRRHPENLGD